MYKYDIPASNGSQFTLFCNGFPINVSKNVSYLKTKMKAHRDEYGSEGKGAYRIDAPDGTTVFTRDYKEGEAGNSTTSYHVIAPKPDIKYKTVYLYSPEEPLAESEREDAWPLTSYEAICDEDGAFVTDLVLLKKLSDLLYRSRIPVTVSKKVLVSLATYPPKTKEEFVALPGFGEKTFAKCGEFFLVAISEHLSENAPKGEGHGEDR